MRSAGHRVIVLAGSRRGDRGATNGLRDEFDELVAASSSDDESPVCGKHGIDVFFDDQYERIVAVPECVLVRKVRNGGEFKLAKRRWLSTTRLTDHLR